MKLKELKNIIENLDDDHQVYFEDLDEDLYIVRYVEIDEVTHSITFKNYL